MGHCPNCDCQQLVPSLYILQFDSSLNYLYTFILRFLSRLKMGCTRYFALMAIALVFVPNFECSELARGWGDDIKWVTLEKAMELSVEEKKPVMVWSRFRWLRKLMSLRLKRNRPWSWNENWLIWFFLIEYLLILSPKGDHPQDVVWGV